MIEAAWIEEGYWRITEALWCCPRCHAATPKPDEHTVWHADEDQGDVTRVRNLLRLRSGNARVV